MTLPIIGIAGNKQTPGSGDFFDTTLSYTPEGFVRAIQKVGGLPLILPISTPELASQYISRIDKLLLTGGQDIAPQLYHEEPHPKMGQIDLERDLFEQALITEALKQNKPIFAVCRGFQLLNVYFGGTLYQDLSLYPNWKINHLQTNTNPIYPTHSVRIEDTGYLASIIKKPSLMVNSYHHQAIKELAPNLTATAYSKDNLIEALEYPEKRIIGVQWHPELSYLTDENNFNLFNFFVHQL